MLQEAAPVRTDGDPLWPEVGGVPGRRQMSLPSARNWGPWSQESALPPMATVPPEPVSNPYFPCRPGEGVIVARVGVIDALMCWFPVRRPQCSGHGTGTICCRSGPPRPTETVPSGQGSGGRPWRGGKNRVGRGVGARSHPWEASPGTTERGGWGWGPEAHRRNLPLQPPSPAAAEETERPGAWQGPQGGKSASTG